MRLTLTFYYLVKEKMITREEKMITRERKGKNIIEIKEKKQNRNKCLVLLYGLLCKYNSTYTNLY